MPEFNERLSEERHTLQHLLNEAANGRIAAFAVVPADKMDIRLNKISFLADARGRLLCPDYINQPQDTKEDMSLGFDFGFSTSDTDLNMTPATVVCDKVEYMGDIFTVNVIKLSDADADYLLGVLPDEVMGINFTLYTH